MKALRLSVYNISIEVSILKGACMYCIIDDGAIQYMSTIIGVCGTNFCTLCADSRKVAYGSGGVEVVNDSTQKIFKLNDRVLFGAMGIFSSYESFLAPFEVYPDKSVITVRMAYKAVIDHINRNMNSICGCMFRNYFVGGKDNKGRFCIYEIHLNTETKEIETTLRIPEPPTYNFSVSCGLPFSLQTQKQEYIGLVGDAVTSCSTHAQMVDSLKNIINKIAENDVTVGGEVRVVSVF